MAEIKNILQGSKITLPKEIIYESGLEGPIGIALALIRESEPHYHNYTTEWYMVTKGSGTVYLNNEEKQLKEYDTSKISPKTIHYVKSDNEIELWVITSPPWKKEDHHLVKI